MGRAATFADSPLERRAPPADRKSVGETSADRQIVSAGAGAHQATLRSLEALLRDRGAHQVAQERLASGHVEGARARGRVQGEARSGDPATALRVLIIAGLGLRKTSPEVTDELDVARSTVVRTAHRYAEEGIAGLFDKRRNNGKPKARSTTRACLTGSRDDHHGT